MVTDKLPAGISEYLRPLIKTMTFQSALELSLSFYDKVRENEGKIEKTMLYPFVLLFVSLTALYLFDAYGLDQILEMLKSFKTDLASFTVIRILIRIVVYLFYFGMLAGVCILLYFTRNRNITIFYILCCKYLKSGLIQVYFCEEFISLFLICLELGYKTKDSLDILKALHNKPLVSFLAFHLDERLLEGDSLKEASRQPYYDETLSKFINVAVHTNDFERILSDYVQLGRKKIISYMNKLALYIQLSSYVMIGVIIIFIYQILFQVQTLTRIYLCKTCRMR